MEREGQLVFVHSCLARLVRCSFCSWIHERIHESLNMTNGVVFGPLKVGGITIIYSIYLRFLQFISCELASHHSKATVSASKEIKFLIAFNTVHVVWSSIFSRCWSREREFYNFVTNWARESVNKEGTEATKLLC